MSASQRTIGTIWLFAVLAILLLCNRSRAAVVTDNNLVTTSLGSLTSVGNTPSVGFSVNSYRLIGLTSTVASTNNGSPSSTYTIDSIDDAPGAAWSGGTPPSYLVNGNHFIQTAGFPQFGELNADGSYGPKSHRMSYGVRAAPPSLYYNLRVGSVFGFLGWNFQATNINLYTPKGADAGLIDGFYNNRVPNASFEDSAFNFFGTGTFVADPGKQGSQVWRSATSSVDQWIALPVAAGETYAFSFWYFRSTVPGSDTEVEYGLTQPTFRGAQGSNSLAFGTPGQWVEATGTFTPTAGQDNFYISAFANGGYVQLDSLFLAAVPEPAGLTVLMAGGSLLLTSRKRQRRT